MQFCPDDNMNLRNAFPPISTPSGDTKIKSRNTKIQRNNFEYVLKIYVNKRKKNMNSNK